MKKNKEPLQWKAYFFENPQSLFKSLFPEGDKIRMESSKGIVVHVDAASSSNPEAGKPKNWGNLNIIIPSTVKNDQGQDVSPELVAELHTVFQKYDRQAAQFLYDAMPQRKAPWPPVNYENQ